MGDQVNSYLEGLRPKQLEEYHNAFQIGAIQPAGKKEKKRASPPKRAAAAKPTPPVQQVDYDDDDDDDDVEDFTCQFCLKHDASFTDDVLDIHYWSKCEMLTPCGQCEQVIEISCLNDHLLTECKYKNHNKECKRCGEAINADYIKDHVARSDCAVQLPENEANRYDLYSILCLKKTKLLKMLVVHCVMKTLVQVKEVGETICCEKNVRKTSDLYNKKV